MDKEQAINFALNDVLNILHLARADKNIGIEYIRTTQENLKRFSEWDRERFVMLTGEELFLVSDNRTNHLLYVVNVTGDSVLTAMAELMNMIANKF